MYASRSSAGRAVPVPPGGAAAPAGPARPLPPLGRALRRAIAAQRALLLADARGPLLDLDAESHLDAAPRSDAEPASDAGRGPDSRSDSRTVLSVLHLARLDDPAAALARARRLMGPEGRLLLLEPLRRPGWRGVVTDVGTPLLRLATGLRADLPVPALVRAAGLTIVSVERTSMPTLVAPLRWFVRLVAVPTPALPPGPVAVGGPTASPHPGRPGGDDR